RIPCSLSRTGLTWHAMEAFSQRDARLASVKHVMGVDDDKNDKVANRRRKDRAGSVAERGDVRAVWNRTGNGIRFRRDRGTGNLGRHGRAPAGREDRGASPWAPRGRPLRREGTWPDTLGRAARVCRGG